MFYLLCNNRLKEKSELLINWKYERNSIGIYSENDLSDLVGLIS